MSHTWRRQYGPPAGRAELCSDVFVLLYVKHLLHAVCWWLSYANFARESSNCHSLSLHLPVNKMKLENVVIVKALQLEATWATPALCRFNYDAKFDVAEHIHCRIVAFLLLIHYYTMWPWPLTLWSWPLTLNICSVSPVTWWISAPNLNAIEQSAAELL